MKYLAAVIIIFVVSFLVLAIEDSPHPLPSPGKESQPVQNPGADESQKAGPPNAASKNFSASIDLQDGAPVGKQDVQYSSTQPGQKSSQSWTWTWNEMTILTLALVFVECVQAFIYYRQARLMRKSLEVTRQAADAAKISAETTLRQTKVMESRERPWVMATPGDPKRGWPVKGNEPYSEPYLFRLPWTIKNVGSGPAFLKKFYVAVATADLPIPDQTMPLPELEEFAKFILPPNGEQERPTKSIIPPEEIEGYVNGQKCIVLHGLIVYEDTLGDPHRTRFCCYWERQDGGNRFHPVGPPKTVEYT